MGSERAWDKQKEIWSAVTLVREKALRLATLTEMRLGPSWSGRQLGFERRDTRLTVT